MLHARKVYINHMGTYLLDPREQALRELTRHIGGISTALAGRIVGTDLPATGATATTVASFMDSLDAGRNA